jgi:hypothetical protein
MSKPHGVCIVNGCTSLTHARDMCRKHCGRFYRGLPLEEDLTNRPIGRMASRTMTSEFSLRHQLSSMELEYADATNRYNLVVGLDNRIRLARLRRELLARMEIARRDLAAMQAEDAVVVAVLTPAEDVVCAVMVG